MQVASPAISAQENSLNPIPSTGVVGGLMAAIVARRKQAVTDRQLRSAIASLSALDDKALADIGVYRSQIEQVVKTGQR